MQTRHDLVYCVNETIPFSGTVVEEYKDGEVFCMKTYENGKVSPNCIITKWWGNGQKQ